MGRTARDSPPALSRHNVRVGFAFRPRLLQEADWSSDLHINSVGYAAGGRKEDHGQPCFAHIVAKLGVHPAHVVVVRKDDVVKGVGIQEVIAQHLIQPDPVGMPSLLFVPPLITS